MIQDIDILIQLIKDSALVKKQEKYSKMMVNLIEPQDPESNVTIYNLPDDAIIIRVDKFRSPDAVFNGKNGECKRADFVIISADKKCIIYIEMKRNRDQWNQIVKQLQGAQCFMKYCQEIGKCFWNKNEFLKGYKSRFISIRHINIPKRKTRFFRESQSHDTPEKAMKIDWPNKLQFNKLAGMSS